MSLPDGDAYNTHCLGLFEARYAPFSTNLLSNEKDGTLFSIGNQFFKSNPDIFLLGILSISQSMEFCFTLFPQPTHQIRHQGNFARNPMIL